MKHRNDNWDREPKIHKVEKGKNKAGKHRKNIYNMLSDFDDEFESDSERGNVKHSYNGNFNYNKQR